MLITYDSCPARAARCRIALGCFLRHTPASLVHGDTLRRIATGLRLVSNGSEVIPRKHHHHSNLYFQPLHSRPLNRKAASDIDKRDRPSTLIMAASGGASSISVTVRVRPFTIREAAQLTKCDDGPLFLGDGSLAAVPTPKLIQKGIRPVIKVVDDKCLYVNCFEVYLWY